MAAASRRWRCRPRGCIFSAVAVMAVALVFFWGLWSMLLLRTGPVIKTLPVAVHNRLKAHEAGYAPLPRIPVMLQEAVIATEDRNFYTNPGIDIEGIIRSALVDIYYARYVEGGSTITQQLAKDMLLNPHKTLWRKVKETLLALVINHYYTKDQVLEMYLNEVYLGNGAYGVDQAAHVYFGEPLEKLTPAQCTLLAGLLQGPSVYDPFTHLQAARQRQWEVLDSMVDSGYLTQPGARAIFSAPLGFKR